MAFKVGDRVVHQVHGVGQVVGVAEKQFSGQAAGLYYEVVTEKSTLWVRSSGADRSADELRVLATHSSVARCGRLLKGRPAQLNQDHRQRQLEVAARLKGGSFQALCEVVRDITARSWRKPLNEADAALLRAARERLCQEWAVVEGMAVADAAKRVDDLLREARLAFSA